MATEMVAQLPPRAWISPKTVGYDGSIDLVAASGQKARGLGFPKQFNTASAGEESTYVAFALIPAALTMGTGLTVKALVTDDGSDSSDLGKVARFGVTVKRMIAGETLDFTSAATEQTVDVTLQAATGAVTVASLAIANANLDSAVVGDTILIRLRRIGTHANDTCKGRVVVPHVYLLNT